MFLGFLFLVVLMFGFNVSWLGCVWFMCEIKNGRNLLLIFLYGILFVRVFYEKILLI